MIKSHCTVRIHFNRPAVFIEGTWFFVHEEVGTRGYFKAHPQDLLAYMVSEDEMITV